MSEGGGEGVRQYAGRQSCTLSQQWLERRVKVYSGTSVKGNSEERKLRIKETPNKGQDSEHQNVTFL